MIELRFSNGAPQRALGSRPYREWRRPDDRVWARFYRTREGYTIRFPRLADFDMSADAARVHCRPAPRTSRAACRNLFANQVWPLVLSRRGECVFHGSAVAFPSGAVAFVAPSGSGKSTLAAALALGGHPFLTDDGLLLTRDEGRIWALPSHPSIRLRDDSGEALLGDLGVAGESTYYNAKACFAAGEALPFCADRRRLLAVYFLEEEETVRTRIRSLAPGETWTLWIKNSFILDPAERPLIASHFDEVARIVNEVPAFRLGYRRRFEALPSVLRTIRRHVMDLLR